MQVQQRRCIQGLQVVAIHDPQATRAAALLQVTAGSLHEPARWPGLAHLLEHLLFAGSRTFQGEERLMAWLPAHGGRLNATTREADSAYFFECAAPLLPQALRRIGDMLAAPLLDPQAIAQEVATIDAECRLLADRAETLCDAALSAAFAAHPWQRFRIGDREHFGEDSAALQQALRHFHRTHYRAENCTLWLQGPQPPEALWQLAEDVARQFAAGDTPQDDELLVEISDAPSSARRHSAPVNTLNGSAASVTLSGDSPLVVAGATAVSPLPRLRLNPQRQLILQLPAGACLRFSFLIDGQFSGELTLLRQLLLDEAEGSLMAALRNEGLADGVRLLLPYQSPQQQLVSIEFYGGERQDRAALAAWLQHWLTRLALLSERQRDHYAALARRQFARQPPLEQLRDRALAFPPPGSTQVFSPSEHSSGGAQNASASEHCSGETQIFSSPEHSSGSTQLFLSLECSTQRWLSLLGQFSAQGMISLIVTDRAVDMRQTQQGFLLSLAVGSAESAKSTDSTESTDSIESAGLAASAESIGHAAAGLLRFFPQAQQLTSTVLPANAVALPHYRPQPSGGTDNAVLLLSPTAPLPAPWGDTLLAALRPLAGSLAHQGGELTFRNQQGLWLLQLAAPAALMRTALAAIAARLAHLPAAALAAGKREARRRRVMERGDIAVRALLAELPALLNECVSASSEESFPGGAWQAALYGGSEALRGDLARLLTAFPAAVNPSCGINQVSQATLHPFSSLPMPMPMPMPMPTAAAVISPARITGALPAAVTQASPVPEDALWEASPGLAALSGLPVPSTAVVGGEQAESPSDRGVHRPIPTDSREHALLLFCPLLEQSAACLAAWQLLAACYAQPFFQQLRVEQNIGYAVSCRFYQAAGRSGVLFILQSPQLSVDELAGRIEAFLQGMTPSLAALTPQDLAARSASLVGDLTEQPADAMAQSLKHWLQQRYGQDGLSAAHFSRITPQRLLAWHRRLIVERAGWWWVSNATQE